MLRANDDVALLREVETAGAGHAVDGRDDGLLQLLTLGSDLAAGILVGEGVVLRFGMSPRSIPVQNALSPAPVGTTTRTPSS